MKLSRESADAIKRVLGNELNEQIVEATNMVGRAIMPLEGHNGLADATIEMCKETEKIYNNVFIPGLLGVADQAKEVEEYADLFQTKLASKVVSASTAGVDVTVPKIGTPSL